MYYAARMTDDGHAGKNMASYHYDADLDANGESMYMEAMRDLKFTAGNAAMNFLRGPMFSNLLKRDLIKSGKFFLSQFSEAELRERIFFGTAIPSVRALNDGPAEAKIDCGGMSEPLAQGVAILLLRLDDCVGLFHLVEGAPERALQRLRVHAR